MLRAHGKSPLGEIKKRRHKWAGRACRKEGAPIRQIESSVTRGKRFMGWPWKRLEDQVRSDVEKAKLEGNWQRLAARN